MKKWKRFEEAVAVWFAALDPAARVTHDMKTPDRDTGKLRQRDVWIEATVCGIIPIRVHISCKRYKCRVNQQHMDAFLGELQSSGAHKGVFYSFSGFSDNALDKAKARGVSCCTLYQDEPAQIPKSLFVQLYCLPSSFSLTVRGGTSPHWRDFTFRDVFGTRNLEGQQVLVCLTQTFFENQERAVAAVRETHTFPRPWHSTIELSPDKSGAAPLLLQLNGMWRVYRAKLQAHLLDGTYFFEESRFFGTLRGPVIDMHGPEPGPGWELLTSPPAVLEPGVALSILRGGDVAGPLLERYGETKLGELA